MNIVNEYLREITIEISNSGMRDTKARCCETGGDVIMKIIDECEKEGQREMVVFLKNGVRGTK